MKAKSFYVCSACEYRSAKYYGRCPSCGAWETFVEQEPEPEGRAGTLSAVKAAAGAARILPRGESRAVRYRELEMPAYMRSKSGMKELDRVLGGGIVEGSVLLIAGEPGIGKSTLLMQISGVLGREKRVLYVSGEESGGQLKYRAQRLGVEGEELYIMTETEVEEILLECERLKPEYLIVDSVQTMYCSTVSSSPGSVTQVKESAMRFISLAKNFGVSVLIVGHVNKEGSIAGPKVLEHMVDAVINFEGERQQAYRVIRASKNRYGATNEIGVFEMTDRGLFEVDNPSEVFLADRPRGVSGNCALCLLEGTRPLVTEIQALTAQTVYPSPKRTSDGVDYNRLCLMLAVLEKRLGLRFSTVDTYVNVIGGIRPDEPAADLAMALALISGIKDIPLADSLLAFGEVGLAGECRGVDAAGLRIKEAAKLGFTTVVLPYKNFEQLKKTGELFPEVQYLPVKSIFDAMKIFVK